MYHLFWMAVGYSIAFVLLYTIVNRTLPVALREYVVHVEGGTIHYNRVSISKFLTFPSIIRYPRLCKVFLE